MSEANFSKRLRDKLSKNNSYLSIWTFEGCNLGSTGTPDLYCVSRARGPFWIEVKRVPRCSCKIPFRPAQPQWLDTHARAGGRAYIIALTDAEGMIYVIPAQECQKLKTLPLNKIPPSRRFLFEDSAEGWEDLKTFLEG